MMITKYEFRPGSSGDGRRRGGVGLVRRYKALAEDTTLTILADREFHRPWGLLGGLPGKTTESTVTRRRQVARVSCKSTLTLDSGDEFEVRTAGGGGYGPPGERPKADRKRDRENSLA